MQNKIFRLFISYLSMNKFIEGIRYVYKKLRKYYNKFINYFIGIKQDWDESKNIFYFLNKRKILLGGVCAFLGFVFGVIGFLKEGKHTLESMTNTFALFALNTPDNYDETNAYFLVSTVFICITLFSTALFAFFQEFVNWFIAKRITAKNHITVFGLGEINRAFLNSNFDNENVLIIESDSNNNYIDEYREKGFGISIGDSLSEKQLELLNFETMEHALIAMGNDRVNIELAIKIIDSIIKFSPKTPTRLNVHISNSELKEIFHQEFILPQKSKLNLKSFTFSKKKLLIPIILKNRWDNFIKKYQIKIDVKTFSFYEECSKNLFENNYIIPNSIISTNKPFGSLILGNGELAIALIKDLLLLSNFPNENKHRITVITKNGASFFESIKFSTHYEIEKFPNIEFNIIENNWKTLGFYKEEIFNDESLKNIYVCYDDEEINLNLAMKLNDKIYLKDASKETKIYFGMFKEYSLSKKINKNRSSFDRFFTFGNLEDIFSKEKLIDEENYTIAKAIHYGYGDLINDSKLICSTNLNEKWFNTAKYSDKLSNIAQAKHINIKLQALGLKKERVDKSSEDILVQNKKVFDPIINSLFEELGISKQTIIDASKELKPFWSGEKYNILYMPQKYDSLFEKLINMEHERWNSYHYLNGWDYNQSKDKSKKLHNCLKALNKFEEPELQITILYDIYSILYIPNYLATAGWEIYIDDSFN